MPTKPSGPGPYESALDLPSVVEMLEQIRGAKILTLFVARKHRREIKEIEKQVRDMFGLVDRFYDLLSDKHWVFHDDLNLEKVKVILDGDLTLDEAEQQLIGLYQDSRALDFMILRLRKFEAMRDRFDLIEKAKADYQAERYYATVQVLISVMDGFVNDFEREQRRGLAARDADEMAAWDSVVGHHRGLSHAHEAFTKSFKKTVKDEVFELYRHGIVHGMVVSYDNVVVATKAWNRLFAVADWATSREKQKAQAEQEPEKPLFEVLKDAVEDKRKTDAKKELIAQWQPRTLSSGNEGFEDEEVFQAANAYLTGWQSKNYKQMADLILPKLTEDNTRRMAGRVREECSLFEDLQSFEITRLDFRPAACDVDAVLTFKDEQKPAQMFWIREYEGVPAVPGEPGQWYISVWGPVAIFNRAERNDNQAHN